jgi:hypothetical protein
MHAPDILRRCWYPLLKACDLFEMVSQLDERGQPKLDAKGAPVIVERPIYHFRHLRHAAASLLIEQRALPKRIMEIMGHSSIRVTFDIYGHLFKDAVADQALMTGAERQLFDHAVLARRCDTDATRWPESRRKPRVAPDCKSDYFILAKLPSLLKRAGILHRRLSR